MKKTAKIVVALLLAMVMVLTVFAAVACDKDDLCKDGHKLKAVERKEATTEAAGYEAYWECENCHKLFSDSEGKNEIQKPVEIGKLDPTAEKGSENNPYTVTEAIAAAQALGSGNYSENQVWIQGYVTGKTTDSNQAENTYRFDIIDQGKPDSKFNVYYAQFENGKPFENDQVLIHGYLQNYNNTSFESSTSKGGQQSEHTGKILNRGTSTITAATVEHATITLDKTSGENGTTFTFSVTVDSEYKISAVKVNGVAVAESAGKYTGTIEGPTTVSVDVEPLGGEPGILATFKLGDDGDASHADGTELSADTWSDSSNDYTLQFDESSKVYSGARDAKGNGCLKLGTGKAAGSFTFTVGEDVKVVKIYIACYKHSGNAATVTINGTDTVLTSESNNGDYQIITVDTSTTKTVSLSFASGTRCMINTIQFCTVA